MRNKNIFYIITTVVISIIILILIYNTISDNYKINQGKFRVQDIVFSNTLDVLSNTDKYNSLAFSADLNNKVVLLIKPLEDVEISEIYMKNITPGELYFSDNTLKDIQVKNIKKTNIEYIIQEDGQILIELEFIKKQIIKEYVFDDSQEILPYDGRAINLAGVNLKDIVFYLEFDIYILESSGRLNQLKIKIETPKEELLTEGEFINNLDLTEFVFSLK